MLVSVVIRTLNEARYLGELLKGIQTQELDGFEIEIVVIDSGSNDGTLDIAAQYGCVITNITREQFSFGRSLNWGCEAAKGDVMVLVSGHCIPTNDHWLQNLCTPVAKGVVGYSYGRQIGGDTSHFSEMRIFAKYFPEQSAVPQDGFFCNNANSALARSVWERHRFDEELTGLEDMELAQRYHRAGGRIGYVAEACVHHLHSESWAQVRRRFEREAIALQRIMPQIHVHPWDTARYILRSVWRDWAAAKQHPTVKAQLSDIARYRYHQYIGSYLGNHEHRKLSHAEKEKYFYPH